MRDAGINQMIQRVLPWDCRVCMGGIEYRIRPLRVADFGALFIAGDAIERKNYGPLLEILDDLFDGAKPTLSDWPVEAISAFFDSIQKYLLDSITQHLPTESGGSGRGGNSELGFAEFIAAVVEAGQGSYSPDDVLAMRVDWAFMVLGGRAKLMMRLRKNSGSETIQNSDAGRQSWNIVNPKEYEQFSNFMLGTGLARRGKQ